MVAGNYKTTFKDKIGIKILLLGEPAVGKTSLRRQYMGEGFKKNLMMTIGAEFAIKVVDKYRLQIWDLSGQHTLSKIRRNYYKGAKGAILVYDVSRLDTFTQIQGWIDEMYQHNQTKIPLVLVGNKADLKDANSVNFSDAKIYARKLREASGYEVNCFEASALTGLNVDSLFEKLVEEIGDYIEMQM